MILKELSLFNTKKEFFYLLGASFFILIYSLLIEYNNYKNLTKFDSNLVDAVVLKQYEKTKLTKKGNTKTYQVLKLESERGFSFYTTASKKFPESKGKELKLEIWAGDISFYEYMTSFYAFSKVLNIDTESTLKQKLNTYIDKQHQNQDVTAIYQALFTAKPLPYKLQDIFSYLGISHLLAISGFHLGVLSFVLFFLFKYPYKFFQSQFFPYRSYKVDSFITIASILLVYLLFLDSPPSLLRAFVMLLIGAFLYDRGYKILSMQTLLLTAIIILSFSPRLVYSLGFWLSVGGVFYIFLFLIHFKELSKLWQFILLPIWVYLMMIPHSLYIFENFSLYHPLSILWTTLFSIFYPISIVLHILNIGDLFDNLLIWLMNLHQSTDKISISFYIEILFIAMSFLSIKEKNLAIALVLFSISIFAYSLYKL